ncbi:MAG: ABC transporter substrate-binding protein [Sandaracinaceae bacterium]|nr:ABC transporter substrate-binding protein [Sandaracinaceae bacterium]
MPSTRRSESLAGLVGLGALGIAGLLIAVALPPAPTAPRYAGAGHETPQRGGTFVFHHEADVRGFDPHIAFDELSNMGIKLMYEGLIDYDRDTLELVPRLAEAVPEPSEDGRTYRFRLRADIRFADHVVFCEDPETAPRPCPGRPITAEDVRWSLEHMLATSTGSPGVTFFELIEGVEAYREGEASHVSGIRVLDERTVEMQLLRADQTFLFAMAMTFAYPVAHEAYEVYGDDVARHPVGTGAYILERWEPGVQLDFVRNPSFFIEGQPYVDRMVYILNLSRQAAVMRFRNGEIDHIHRQTPADYRLLKSYPAWEPYRLEEPKVNIWGIGMNCELAPFDNRHMRRAVAFALNTERWKRARAGRLLLSGQPIPRPLPGFDPDLPGQHHFDLDVAREEMRLAGYPDGYPEPLTLTMSDGETARFYGELVQQDLRAIGIEIEIRQISFPIWLQQTGTRRTVLMALQGWSMDYPDAANFLDILFHSRSIHETDSENKAFYSNPEVDRLLDAARVERDRPTRLGMYREASRIIVDDAPWGFTFSDLAMEMWQPYVHNYRPNPVWSNFFRDVWLDLPRRRVALWERAPTRSVPALTPFGGRP